MKTLLWCSLALLIPLSVLAQITWTEHTVDGDFYGGDAVYAEDVDGDGDIDVLGAARNADDITWWENVNGDGLTWTEHTVDGNFNQPQDVYAEDVDGDGDMDVLGAAWLDDDITWWENVNGDGLTWTEHIVDGSFNGTMCVYAEDIDGDGDIDVLGAAQHDNDITWWENVNGDGLTWTEHTVDGNFNYATWAYAEDMDGDGDMDVLGAAYFGDDIAWWENVNGDGLTWTEHMVDSMFDGPQCTYAEDVDGDGDMDVLGAAASAHEITWWENVNGDGLTWTEHTVGMNVVGAISVYAIDLDDDCDVDVLGQSANNDEIIWWENVNGDGLTWTEHLVDGDTNQPMSVYAEDVDGDGDMDILGAAELSNDVTWWEQHPPVIDELAFDTFEDGDWTSDPSWLTEGLAPGIEMVAGGYSGSDWSLGLFEYGAMSYGTMSIALESMPEFAIDLWVKKRPNLTNNHFSVEITNGTYAHDTGLRYSEHDGIVEVLWQGASLGSASIDMSIDRWYPVLMQRSDDGTWELYWDNMIQFDGIPDDFSCLNNLYFTIYGYGNGGEGGVLFDDIFFYDAPQEPATPTGLIADLSLAIQDLLDDAVLERGQANALTVKLEGAVKKIDRGQYHVAINMLNAFINQTMSLVDEGILTQTEGDILINLAYQSIAQLENAHISAQDEFVLQVPQSFAVSHSFPNPFNASTQLTVTLPETSHLDVVVYNITGQQAAELANGQFNAGRHTLTFDASNLASGLYFMQATVPGHLYATQKVMLIR
jgi:FG-GAP-like repeat/Secretion system C-terminal sorting domain